MGFLLLMDNDSNYWKNNNRLKKRPLYRDSHRALREHLGIRRTVISIYDECLFLHGI